MAKEAGADSQPWPAWTGCVWFLILCFVGSVIVNLFTIDGLETWYRTLKAPAFTPPDLVFPMVWMVLYGLIAVAGWRLWRHRQSVVGRLALAAWGLQLALNFAWPILFFSLHRLGLALAEIALMAAAIAVTIVLALKADRPAAVLLLPYLAWVAFTGVLNEAFLRLN